MKIRDFPITFEANRTKGIRDFYKRFITLKNKVRIVRGIDVRRIGCCTAAGEHGCNTMCFKRLRHGEADIGERTFAGDHSGLLRRRGRVRRDSLTMRYWR